MCHFIIHSNVLTTVSNRLLSSTQLNETLVKRKLNVLRIIIIIKISIQSFAFIIYHYQDSAPIQHKTVHKAKVEEKNKKINSII